MSLSLYREISTGTYTVHGLYGQEDGVLPITTTMDGRLGEVSEIKLFLRNDESNEYYENIEITPESLTSPNDVIGTASGWGVKLRAGESQPTEAEWDAIDYGSAIEMDDIGSGLGADTSTYAAFWYRIECPAGQPAQTKTNIVLTVSYTASPV